ncbi:HAMP domain-containing histidine kinase [Listeria welshimeri]|nr:HAMP domain-containing histidine kinase [Listeria welshimeri]
MTTSPFSLKSRSLKFKWTFGASAAIFLTFFLFSYAIYQGIGQMLLNEEEPEVKELLLATTSTLTNQDLSDNEEIKYLFNNDKTVNRKLQDQVINLYDKDGHFINKYYFSRNQDITSIDFSQYFVSGTDKFIMNKPTIDGQKMMTAQMPIVSDDNTTVIGYAQVVNPLTSYNRMMDRLLVTMILLGAVALLISGMLGYLLAQNFLNPLTRLARTMNDIRKNGFQKRIETKTNSRDEIGELTVVFNDMMTRIETSFEQQKQFVEDASHELRTPVQIMEGHLKLLTRWGKDDPAVLDESLNASLTELERMKKLVQEMLDLSRAEQISQTKELQITDVNAIVEQVRRNFEVMYENFTFKLKEDDTDLRALIQHNHLEQILIIIMDNAVKYSGDGTEVDLHVYKEQKQIHIDVRDYGEGISQEEIDKIFNRFYRVDKARSREKGGNGLGLAIAKQLVEGYLGTINAVSEPDKGTTIKITLPYIDPKSK